MVIADAEQMKRVINNIISNSVKYLDKKKGIINIRIKDVGDFIPVSYTHLDVYKRQPLRRFFRKGMGSVTPMNLSQSLKMKAFGLHRRSTMWPAAAPSERVLIQAH